MGDNCTIKALCTIEMACPTLFYVCLVATMVAGSFGASVTKEVDDYGDKYEANRTIHRSEAGNGFNILLYSGEDIEIPFCLDFNDNVRLQDFYYSNDGSADIYIFEIDNIPVGNVTSISNSNRGHNWNVINKAGSIGSSISLTSGPHVAKVTVQSLGEDDGYGAEMDSLGFGIEDEANGDLSCYHTTTFSYHTGSTTQLPAL